MILFIVRQISVLLVFVKKKKKFFKNDMGRGPGGCN